MSITTLSLGPASRTHSLARRLRRAADGIIYLVAAALDVLAAALLGAALNHQVRCAAAERVASSAPNSKIKTTHAQRRHRSADAVRVPARNVQQQARDGGGEGERRALLGRAAADCSMPDAWQATSAALALACAGALALNAAAGRSSTADWRYWLFAGLFAAQRLPNIALVLRVVLAYDSADVSFCFLFFCIFCWIKFG